MLNRSPITGPFHGIMSDTPPTVDLQGFEDLVNFIGFKGRLRLRPGLDLDNQFTAPDMHPILNMTSFEDAENFLHTLAWTAYNLYALTAGPVLNLLTFPQYIKTVKLNLGGINYSLYDIINIEQVGGEGGSAIVTAVASNPVTFILGFTNAGTGYTVGDILIIDLPGSSSTASFSVDTIGGGGDITGWTLLDGGYDYANAGAVATAGGSGTGATVNITTGGVVTEADPDAVGNGYTVGDILTLIEPNADGATVQVDSIDGSGGITGSTLLTGGNGYTSTTGLAVTGGTGHLATFDTVATSPPSGVITDITLDGVGQGYTDGTNLPTDGGTGTGATVDITTTTFTSLSGMNATDLPYAIVKAQNKVYFCNGSVPLCYADGEASFKVAGDVPGACRFLTTNANHLLGAFWTEPDPTQPGAITYPQRVRVSDSGNFNEWDEVDPQFTAYVFDISDVPDNITGLSTIGYYSYAYRTNGVTILTPTGNAGEPFQAQNSSIAPKGEGCVYPYSLTSHKNIDRFIGNYDVWAFDGQTFTPLMDGKCNAQFFADLAQASGIYQVRGNIVIVLDNGYPFLGYSITIPGANVAWLLNITENSWTRLSWAPFDTGQTGFYDLQFIEQVYLT